MIFSIYLIQTPEINQVFFVFFIAIIVILHSSFFFNSFGLDNIVADRYRIFPVTPKAIFTAKNRAILFILSVELFPLLLLNLILSQHILLIGYYCLIILSMILVYCLVGNITSVLLAGPRRYSHFGDNKASGSGRIFVATLCWVIPLYLHDILKGDLIRGIFFYACVCMVFFIAFFALKKKIGLLFEERKEELRKKLL